MVSFCSDGWRNTQKRLIINFMAVIKSGRMFLNFINAEGEVKNKQYIMEKFEDCTKEVGANVIQIIINNVSACKITVAIVESKYPHIFLDSLCVAHS